MNWIVLIVLALSAGSASATAALAQATKAPPSDALKNLTNCRDIANGRERLTCYDREVANLAAAQSRKDVVIVDRQQLNRTRKTLFGLALPDLGLFGSDTPGEEGVSRISSTIKAANQTPYGKWILRLEDGASWVQMDSRDLPISPKPGHPIEIRKAALGSYLANIKGQVAIRVQRLR